MRQSSPVAPLLGGCAECLRGSASHADRTDRRSLLRACAGGLILAIVPSGGCANGDDGGEAGIGKDDGQAGDEPGKPREASVGVSEAGQGEADMNVQAREAGWAGDTDASVQAGEAGRASEADATVQGGGADASARHAESAPPDAGCSANCGTGPLAVEVSFDEYPALAQVGGAVLVQLTAYADPVCGSDVLIVLQPTAGKFLAFSAACTHACCAVSYEASASRFYCGCHGSAFDLTGKVIAGPAKKALTALKVCSDACGVHVMGSS